MHVLAVEAEGTSGIAVTESLIVGLMLVSALVGIAVSRLRLPYTVALVVVGLLLGLAGVFTGIKLTSELILLVFLPPLLFEGSINMDLDDLVLRWKQVAVLAFVGTAISAVFIAVPLVVVPGMGWKLAVVLAVMLAATDPVSVLAIFKDHGVGTGLRTLMEGESIFNDALAIVLYLIALDLAFGVEGVTFTDGLVEFGVEVFVGVATGTVIGFVAHRLMATLDDHLVEITLSLVTAYGSYLVADRLHGSGVIAVVASGLLIGNYGTRLAMSASSRVALLEFWEVLAFLANSALFLVIGLEFDLFDLRGRNLTATLVAIGGMLVGRAVIAFGLLPLVGRERVAPIPRSWQPAVFWGGLRGSIPIALVLGIEVRRFGGVDAVAVVFGVVLFSLIVQGLTYKPLLDRLGLTGKSDDLHRYEALLAETLAMRAAQRELDSLLASGEVVEMLYDDLQSDIGARLSEVERQLAELSRDASGVHDRQVQVAARRLAASQKRALSEAARNGRIGEQIARTMAKQIDVALEEGELARTMGESGDPLLYPNAPQALNGGPEGTDGSKPS
jgi:CPA1 family monovalent cation:H+ antiporter